MDSKTQDRLLHELASGSPPDYDSWPQLLPCILSRIETNVITKLNIPTIPKELTPTLRPVVVPKYPPGSRYDEEPKSGMNAEQCPAASPPAPTPVTPATPATQDPSSIGTPPATADLPPVVASMLAEILEHLSSLFSKYPPHTVQRLAELVLDPKKNYKNVVPYLHALDRVVHVTSSANRFPLPSASMTQSQRMSGAKSAVSTSWANSANFAPSDEESQFGGALLTRIPWATRQIDSTASLALSSSPQYSQVPSPMHSRPATASVLLSRPVAAAEFHTESTETIQGPHGAGSVETVTISLNPTLIPPSSPTLSPVRLASSVTQGELLRLEQCEGVMPTGQLEQQQAQMAQQAQKIHYEQVRRQLARAIATTAHPTAASPPVDAKNVLPSQASQAKQSSAAGSTSASSTTTISGTSSTSSTNIISTATTAIPHDEPTESIGSPPPGGLLVDELDAVATAASNPRSPECSEERSRARDLLDKAALHDVLDFEGAVGRAAESLPSQTKSSSSPPSSPPPQSQNPASEGDDDPESRALSPKSPPKDEESKDL